ncbi:MAG: YidH family protein [Bacillota bacterium]
MAGPDDDFDATTAARKRTDWAEDRTVLANERTFGSWVRTGYGAIGIGLGFHALFGRIHPHWVPLAVATAFLLVAIIIFIAAERRACMVIRRLHTHEVETVKVGVLRLITVVSSGATVALIAAMWMLAG